MSKLTLLAVAVLALFCIAVRSAKAQTYDVTLTGGTGGGCAFGNTGVLTISGDALEFISTGDCNFGTPGLGSGAATCTGSDCSSLDTFGATHYIFTDVGGCDSSTDCTAANSSLSMDFYYDDPGAFAGGTNSCISLGSNNSLDKGLGVEFDDLVETPEPSSILLFGSGLLGLGAIFRQKLGSVTWCFRSTAGLPTSETLTPERPKVGHS